MQAADALAEAAAVAAQRDAEENYKRLAADVQAVMETQGLIQKHQEEFRQRLDKLSDEIRTLKEEQARASGNSVTREELRKYIDKLKEQLDEQREADKKLILGNIKELAKVPVVPAVEPPKTSARHSKEEASDEHYVYTVKKNDRLLDIVVACNEKFQKNGQSKITMEQVLEANPGLKANHLVTGKKIIIPIPPKEAK